MIFQACFSGVISGDLVVTDKHKYGQSLTGLLIRSYIVKQRVNPAAKRILSKSISILVSESKRVSSVSQHHGVKESFLASANHGEKSNSIPASRTKEREVKIVPQFIQLRAVRKSKPQTKIKQKQNPNLRYSPRGWTKD